MASPFPGMDPYIESCGLWGDFHHHLIVQIKHALAQAVPDDYFVRVDARSYMALVDSEATAIYPIGPNMNNGATERGNRLGGESTAESRPRTLRAFVEEEHREVFVKVYQAKPEPHVVTRVEVLSPANKRPDTRGWNLYQRQRRRLLLSSVNFVEIDLLRGGQRPPMLDPWPESPYTLLVARAKKYQLCRVWPGHFQHPLPVIPIPLVKPDADIPLNIQPIIADIYRVSRYASSIDYRKPATPPLNADETTWLEERLRQQQGQT